MEKLKIVKVKSNSSQMEEDSLVEEIPLTIIVNSDKELVTLLCTPENLEDLIRGFLFTSGFISDAADISQIGVDRQRWTAYVKLIKKNVNEDIIFKRLYTSGCGKGTLFYNAHDMLKSEKLKSNLKVKSTVIFMLMQEFKQKSNLYLKTGGAHSAAIADNNGILTFREDIGRHNAIDKIIGHCLKENIFLEDKTLITSGRISSEVLLKAHKCKFPIIISKGAPTNQAVKLARNMNITLAGFVRGKSMNIYSSMERIEVV